MGVQYLSPQLVLLCDLKGRHYIWHQVIQDTAYNLSILIYILYSYLKYDDISHVSNSTEGNLSVFDSLFHITLTWVELFARKLLLVPIPDMKFWRNGLSNKQDSDMKNIKILWQEFIMIEHCCYVVNGALLLQRYEFCVSRRAALIFFHHSLFCYFLNGTNIFFWMTPLYITNPLILSSYCLTIITSKVL